MSRPVDHLELAVSEAKLVRDNVPFIMRRRGEHPIVRTAEPYEYAGLLRAKLVEEVEEFLDSDDPRVLADVMEVLLALGEVFGCDGDDLERMRTEKALERGRFGRRFVWSGNGTAA
jgi:predicted house-cleaning noncanonical NTP pyrophosphatase (MazG superfamily)